MTGREVWVGDVVRVGRGKVTWRVTDLWTVPAPEDLSGSAVASSQLLATLEQIDGDEHTTVNAARLVHIEAPALRTPEGHA